MAEIGFDPTGGVLPAPWNNLTLQALVERSAMEAPARVFLRDCPAREHWNGVEPRSLTCDDLARQSRFLAAQLRALGLQEGEHVMLLLPNVVELSLAVIACRLIGAVPAIAPMDETVDFLRACAERVEAALILTCARVNDVALGEKARHVAARALCVRAVGGFGFDLVEGIVSLEGWSEDEVDPLPDLTAYQGEVGLVTFSREADGPVAALRSEGQVIAEALALHSVLRLDGRRGLVSLMQPGASTTLAAALVLPLYVGASVQLLGPYSPEVLAQAMTALPGAYLFAPDHFIAGLRENTLPGGLLAQASGFLALARIESPRAQILRPGAFKGALAFDFHETGLMTRLAWPIDGKIDLPKRYDHPMESVLPEDVPMLEWHDGTFTGFGAPRLIRKGEAMAGRAA